MHRYNLSDEEKDWLKVAKLNQDKSEALLSEMKALNKEWANINKSHDDFLSSVENMLGMRNSREINREEVLVRESQPVEDLTWSELVEEANKCYSDEINFEDLLSEAEFLEAYERLAEIDKEFTKKPG